MLRSIRTVLATASALVAVGVAILWVHGYSSYDTFPFVQMSEIVASSTSVHGAIKWHYYGWVDGLGPLAPDTIWYDLPLKEAGDQELDRLRTSVGSGFHVARNSERLTLGAPHWFVMVVAASLAVVLKSPPRLRFSTGDLLVAIATTAVLLLALRALAAFKV